MRRLQRWATRADGTRRRLNSRQRRRRPISAEWYPRRAMTASDVSRLEARPGSPGSLPSWLGVDGLLGSRGAVRTARFGAALDLVLVRIDDDRRCVALAHFPLAPDLLEPMAAGDEVLQDRARDA